MKVLVIVEDDADVQFLIETVFSMDPRFTFAGVAAAAEDALTMARTTEPGIIVLDNGLAGRLTGLEVAPSSRSWLRFPRSSSSRPDPSCKNRLRGSPPSTPSCSRRTRVSFSAWPSS